MTAGSIRNQNGYVLLLTVLLLMGIGGVVLAGFTQQAKQELEVQRYQHNQRVLQQAKQALLMFAYNYPQTNTNGIGPGRLPCPDVDNDGTVDGPGTCNQVGRFPWADDRLGIQETLDASGERLWYAVSDAFDNIAGGGVINYGTTGSITLVDQSGGIIYDGFVAGIAAVIIAPGTILKRDEDADGTYEFTQLRDTDPRKIDPRNYLDTFNGFDNSVFTNEGNANGDGFILGPVFDSTQSTIVVNDQLIIVTADEVIAMAEKAVLEAYRDAIEDYLDKVACTGETPEGTGTTEALCLANLGVWNPVYPWLYNYRDVSDIDELSSYYPATASFTDEVDPITGYLGNYGRIPSIFANYFTETGSEPIDTALSGSVGITIPEKVTCIGCNNSFTLIDDEYQFHDFATIKIPSFPENQVLTDVQFVDLGTAGEGQLTGISTTAVSATLEVYFWDYDHSETTIYTPCGDDGDGIPEFTDCNRDISDNPDPGGPNKQDIAILRIKVSLDFPYDAGTDVFNIDMDYTVDPVKTINPATAGSHALISATFADSSIINGSMPVISGVIWDFAEHYHIDDTSIAWNESGTLDSSGFVIEGPLTLGIRYYPELPGWAFDNGWHNSIMMAYADDYRPDTLSGPCTPGTDCLTIANTGGIRNDKVSLLVIAGTNDWSDVDTNGFFDDPESVFDIGNEDLNSDFDARAVGGNDHLLVMEEI